MSTLQPSYKLNIGVNVLPGMVAIGKFDGKAPALAVGTLGDTPRQSHSPSQPVWPDRRCREWNQRAQCTPRPAPRASLCCVQRAWGRRVKCV
jgi:hypothetical protein